MPSPAQIRAARALLGWTQKQLAKAAGLSDPSIKRLELENLAVSQETVDRATAALEAAGIKFIGTTGVDMKGKRK